VILLANHVETGSSFFFAAAALQAGVIQLNPQEIQITGTVTGNGSYTFDFAFYYSGPYTPSDHIVLDTGFDIGVVCPLSTLECLSSFGVGLNIMNSVGTTFEIVTTETETYLGGNETAFLYAPGPGEFFVQYSISQELMGVAASPQNLSTPITATSAIYVAGISPGLSITLVPEPATFSFGFLGLVTLIILGRRTLATRRLAGNLN
jgi:hypothetical protein